jgi:uncharacterized protein
MKPFRKNVAIAIDGGGLRGIIVTKALSILEEELGISLHDTFRIAVGTSTGSIISAAIGMDITAAKMTEMYTELGATIFPRNWRETFFPISRYRYPEEPLRLTLKKYLGNHVMGDFWSHNPPVDVVITSYDLVTNHTLFIKPWKAEYASWTVARAVQCSCTVPTYFPVVEGRYIDGGVGSYANPCYLAAYEAQICLGWNPEETTLISLGTGRDPHTCTPSKTNRMWAWQWLDPLLGAFLQSADDQQVHLVQTFFKNLDFRRFQIDLRESIEMDDPAKIPELTAYGIRLGRMILNDNVDSAQKIVPELPGIRG